MNDASLESALILASLFSETRGEPLAQRLEKLAPHRDTIARALKKAPRPTLNWVEDGPSELDLARAIIASIPRLEALTAGHLYPLFRKTLPRCPRNPKALGRYLSKVARHSRLIASAFLSVGSRRYLFDHDFADNLIAKHLEENK